MSLPVHTDTSKVLQSTIPKINIASFVQWGIQWLSAEVNALMWSKWPKASMISSDLSEYQKQLIIRSQDTVL